MNKNRINNYIFDSILNTNPTILNQFLDEYAKTTRSMSLEKVEDYFYKVKCTSCDYVSAYEFFKTFKYKGGACSSIRVDNLYGRNYDWTYDERVTFYVNCDNDEVPHKSHGISGGLSALTKGSFTTNTWNDLFEMIPFFMLDGINDAGVACNINIAPAGDMGFTTGTNIGKPTLPILMLIRYILDYADSVDHAIALLNERNIIAPAGLEVHFMIADADKTCILEFINNELKVINGSILTNFYMYGFDGTRQSLTDFGSGLERYEILNDGKGAIESVVDLQALMQSVFFSNAYKESVTPLRYTDFVGEYSDRILTTKSDNSDFIPIIERSRYLWNHKTRNGELWQSVHSSIYDLESGDISLQIQEDTTQTYTLSL